MQVPGMAWVYRMLQKAGIVPKFDKEVPRGEYVNYGGIPFEWDRPNTGLYANGVIRVIWRDKAGDIGYGRKATDEEVRFIMLLEDIWAATGNTRPGRPPYRREMLFEAMKEVNFQRTTSCCPMQLEKMCGQDEYKGDLEALVTVLMRKMDARWDLNSYCEEPTV